MSLPETKTLKQILQEKLIDHIFPSFSEEHQQVIIRIITENIKEWLTQKLRKNEKDWNTIMKIAPEIINNFIDELLEDAER